MDFQTVDFVINGYIPVLLVCCVALFAQDCMQNWPGNPRKIGLVIGFLIGALVIAYGLMLLDSQLKWWQAFGLEYVTQSAVALGLVGTLILITPTQWLIWGLALFGYVVVLPPSLMNILSTLAVAGTLQLMWFGFLYLALPANKGQSLRRKYQKRG